MIEEAVMPKLPDEQESKRDDLGGKPENAGRIGEKNKRLNEKGEVPRAPDSKQP